MTKIKTAKVMAEKHRAKMQKYLDDISAVLQAHLGDDGAHIFYQPSDGWVICWNDDCNAGMVDLDLLLSLSQEDAIEYLRRRSI